MQSGGEKLQVSAQGKWRTGWSSKDYQYQRRYTQLSHRSVHKAVPQQTTRLEMQLNVPMQRRDDRDRPPDLSCSSVAPVGSGSPHISAARCMAAAMSLWCRARSWARARRAACSALLLLAGQAASAICRTCSAALQGRTRCQPVSDSLSAAPATNLCACFARWRDRGYQQ